MINAFLSYGIGLLSIANAGEVSSPFLYWANWVIGVLFIVSGSFAGWQAARE